MIVKGSSHPPETDSTAETAVPPDDPPEYIPQSWFHVGKGVALAPFVTPSQLKVHLGLLRAFRELKLKVQEKPDAVNAFPPLAWALDPEARWIWFLELALERYAVRSHSSTDGELRTPLVVFGDGFLPSARYARRLWPWTARPSTFGSSGTRICSTRRMTASCIFCVGFDAYFSQVVRRRSRTCACPSRAQEPPIFAS